MLPPFASGVSQTVISAPEFPISLLRGSSSQGFPGVLFRAGSYLKILQPQGPSFEIKGKNLKLSREWSEHKTTKCVRDYFMIPLLLLKD